MKSFVSNPSYFHFFIKFNKSNIPVCHKNNFHFQFENSTVLVQSGKTLNSKILYNEMENLQADFPFFLPTSFLNTPPHNRCDELHSPQLKYQITNTPYLH